MQVYLTLKYPSHCNECNLLISFCCWGQCQCSCSFNQVSIGWGGATVVLYEIVKCQSIWKVLLFVATVNMWDWNNLSRLLTLARQGSIWKQMSKSEAAVLRLDSQDSSKKKTTHSVVQWWRLKPFQISYCGNFRVSYSWTDRWHNYL